MLVSVIIPTYNRKEFTQEAIDSVIAQTFKDWELIIVDDGSLPGQRPETKDDSTEHLDVARCPELVEGLVEAQRLRIFYRPHRGAAAARNFGVSVSSGKYIAFLDSDDLWEKRKLEKQLDFIKTINEEPRRLVSGSEMEYKICYTDEEWIRNGKHLNQMKKHRKYGGWIFEKCLPLCIISASSIIMEREVFGALGGFDESLPVCEDYDLWLRMALKYPIGFLDEKLIIKRGGHPDQLSQKYWGMDRFRIRVLEKHSGPLVEKELRQKYQVLLSGALKRGKYFFWLWWKLRQVRQAWKRKTRPT